MGLENFRSIDQLAFDGLVNEIREFQEGLADDMEVGIVANAGDGLVRINSLRLSDHVVVFDGVDEQDRQARIIQHYTQIRVQMVAVKKLGQQATRIGF